MIDGFSSVADILPQGNELHTFEELSEWIEERKNSQSVSIRQIGLSVCNPWFYDESSGQIRNPQGSFFQITGLRASFPDGSFAEQPIILQKEIGFLGIICKKINGAWHFLMQAKIEPGNINYVQISPTLQATKSNFTRKHGGREPAYLQYFVHMQPGDILVDQIQSEQSSRFLGKRNRNVIIKTEEDIPETPSHRWMTLRQLKAFMRLDNYINMDTRTVLSCIPYVFLSECLQGYPEDYVSSVRRVDRQTMVSLYLRINNYKMFRAPVLSLIPLKQLSLWQMTDAGISHRSAFPFRIIFCALEIEGREVTRWNQPLFAAEGDAVFGLLCCRTNGQIEILVQLKPEIGCFDAIELGPTVQEEYRSPVPRDETSQYFFRHIARCPATIDVVLSEEGGRFYREQNRNIVVFANKEEVPFDENRYVWAGIGTLNAMTQINNCLNIQLRNLLMLLSMYNN